MIWDFVHWILFAKDILGVFGFSFGFGAEYYFSPAFSISGEYGLNYYQTNGDYKETEEYEEYKYVREGSLSFLLGLIYSRIGLNFHIGGKEDAK
ncbi:MAG: hypothetical protein HY769_07450 [Candidatus Stahlbacteria bacterium]|nr:hypothetical protein [Candidatus Stahlbacteria bacterium]